MTKSIIIKAADICKADEHILIRKDLIDNFASNLFHRIHIQILPQPHLIHGIAQCLDGQIASCLRDNLRYFIVTQLILNIDGRDAQLL